MSSVEAPISPKLVEVFCVLDDSCDDVRDVLSRSVIDANEVDVLDTSRP